MESPPEVQHTSTVSLHSSGRGGCDLPYHVSGPSSRSLEGCQIADAGVQTLGVVEPIYPCAEGAHRRLARGPKAGADFGFEGGEERFGGRVIPRCRLRRLAMVEVGRFG
jgi:hypothetical protein